jgi:hypothetical protein
MTPLECAAACHRAVSRVGAGFMTDRIVSERAASMGLSFFDFYLAGRAGVLGDVGADVVARALAMIEPTTVRAAWLRACASVPPHAVAAGYAECAVEWSDRLAGHEGVDRLAELAAAALASVDLAAHPVASGWRELAAEYAASRAATASGRAVLNLNALREFRGAMHVAAVHSVGLEPVAAIVAGSDGPARAGLLGWRPPYPDPRPFLELREQAERATDVAAAAAFAPLSAAERADFVALVAQTHGYLRIRPES